MAKFITDNEFYCTKCGQKGIPVLRKKGKEREAGHLKKLYCLKCQKETNHVECKLNTQYTKKNFFIEFFGQNFTEKGERKEKYKTFVNNLSSKDLEFINSKIKEFDKSN